MQLYRHSGAVPLGGVLLALIAGTITAALLGVVYTYLIVYIPFIYINFLLTAGFGFVIGLVVSWAAKAGKIRNTPVIGFLGFALGLLGLYFAWATDPVARMDGEIPFTAGFEPGVLLTYMQALYEEGAWTLIGETPVSGIFLAAIWLVEAAVILGLATITSIVSTASVPFCERCHQWTTLEEGVQRLMPRDPQEPVTQRVLAGDLTALNEFDRANGGEPSFLRLDLARCASCADSNFLTIQQVQHSLDSDGDPKTDTTPLLLNLPVQGRDLELIRQAGREVRPEPEGADSDEP